MMSRFVQLAAALLLASASTPVSAATTYPPSSGFLLLASDQFAPKLPPAGSTVITHSTVFTHDYDGLHPNLQTKLDYTAEHSDNVWLLDTDVRVASVECDTETLMVHLSDDPTASSFINDMVVGDTSLVGHCISQGGGYGDIGSEVVFARTIISVQQPDPKVITLATTMVDSSSVYKTANVTFSTNSYGMFSSSNSHCSIWDIIRKQCSAQVNETQTWTDLFHYDYSGQTIWSGKVGTNPEVSADIKCSSCYAKLTPELLFSLQIEGNSLKSVNVVVQGDFEAEVEATADASGSFSQSNPGISLYTIDVPDIVFYVGIFPIHVKFSVPITVNYNVNVNAQATASAGVHFSGQMSAGFGYDNGQWGPRFDETYGYNVIQPTYSASGSAGVKVGLTPSFRLDVDLIASGQIDVLPYVEFDAQASAQVETISKAVVVASPAVSAQAQLYAGMDVDISGTLGLTFHGRSIGPHVSFGPKDVFTLKKEIWSGSFAQKAAKAPAKRRLIQM